MTFFPVSQLLHASAAAAASIITSGFFRLPLGAYFGMYFDIALGAVKSRSEVKC